MNQSWELIVSSNDCCAPPKNEAVLRFDGIYGSYLGVITPILLSDALAYPYQLFVDSSDRLYVSVRGGTNQQLGGINRYDVKNGTLLDKFVPLGQFGDGDAPAYTFGPDGTLFVTVSGEHTIKRFNSVTNEFEVFATDPSGNGFTHIQFGGDGALYASDGGGKAVLAFDGKTGVLLSKFADGASHGVSNAAGFTFGPDGNMYVSG